MKNKDDAQKWFPFWVDKWLFGSTRIELEPDQRGVWIDLMALGAKDNGFIRANPETPYLGKQLAAFLNITEELLANTIQQCVKVNKLQESEIQGIYYIKNWGEFQFCDRWKRELNVVLKKQSSTKTEDTTENVGPIVKDSIEKDRIEKELSVPIPFEKIISYLNQKIGKKFSFKTQVYRKYIKARWNEGKRFEDFVLVVDIKFKKWGSDPKMIDYLRPETLFGTKMDSYLQEEPDGKSGPSDTPPLDPLERRLWEAEKRLRPH